MSEAQPTENITYEATLNAAASASRFPAGAFLDYVGLKKILEALAEMYATGDRPTEGLGACARLLPTKSGPWETFGPQIDRIPSTRPSWRDRQYRKLKKLFFSRSRRPDRPRRPSTF